MVAGEVRSLAGRSADAAKGGSKSLIGASVERVGPAPKQVEAATRHHDRIVASVQRA